MPVVTGVAKYPDGIIEKLSKKYRVVSVDAMDEAIKMGNSRVLLQRIWISQRNSGLK